MVVILLHGSASRGYSDDKLDTFQTIIAGYLSNKSSFSQFRCRFKVRYGEASTVEDALAGTLKSVAVRHGQWNIDGPHYYYELLCDDKSAHETQQRLQAARAGKVPADENGEIRIPIPCSDVRILRNREFALNYKAIIGAANLFPESLEPPHPQFTPFGLQPEETNVSIVFQAALHDESLRLSFDGTEIINGMDTLSISVHRRNTPEIAAKYQVDPSRGFIPIVQWEADSNGHRVYEQHITEIRQFPDGRAFPMRTVIMNSPDGSGPMDVQEIIVVSLEVDVPVSQDEMQIEIAEGIQVNVPSEPHWLTLEQPEIISADELGRLYERCVASGREYAAAVKRAKQYNTGQTKPAPRERQSNTLLWVLVGNLLVLTVIFALYLVRRFRSRSQGGGSR